MTYSERLVALSEGRTLRIEYMGGKVLVNKHTLPSWAWLVRQEGAKCSLVPRPSITAQEFDMACDKLGFAGIIRDSLREELFLC